MTGELVGPVLEGELIGRQSPTFLWVPPHDEHLGVEAIELYESYGRHLDPWQKLLVKLICAIDEVGSWLCFEVAIVVSRQNGKGAVLECLELAWLFLFGDRLIVHSAHLFETSREHFMRMQALVTDYDDLRRRVKTMREGRGSEEIVLLGGQRLKFMSRKGGSGRGFTGSKVVFDEAMYLDLTMMAASLPVLASVANAQVVYAGSAGLRTSTQLGAVRERALARNDPNLMYAEWAADPAVRDDRGNLVAGDDPANPLTWAKTNPALGIRITAAYVRKEMAALGGPDSTAFGTERLGIGDWPTDGAAWEVISEAQWSAQADPGSQIVEGTRIALAIDCDPGRELGTIGVCGRRADGARHVEILERHRGTGWMTEAATAAVRSTPQPVDAPVDGEPAEDTMPGWQADMLARMVELNSKYTVAAVVILPTSGAASLITALKRKGLPVRSPSDTEYAAGCGAFHEGITDTRDVVHLNQPSMNAAVSRGKKRQVAEGAWRWSRSIPVDATPAVTPTLALWGYDHFCKIPRSKVY